MARNPSRRIVLSSILLATLAAGCSDDASSGTSPQDAQDATPSQSDAGAAPTDGGQGSSDAAPSSDAGRQKNCQSSPSRCGYPDKTNTGVPAGTTLTKVSGEMKIDTPNAVIDGKDIDGCVTVTAPGVTIRRSKINCNSYYGILASGAAVANGAARLSVEDVEVVCGGNTTAIGDANVTVKRAYLHGCENGFDLDHDATVEDTYITDVVEVNGGHGDGMQFAGTVSNIVVRHNTIIVGPVTSAVNRTGETTSLLVEDNLLAGGAYTLYCPRVPVASGAFTAINNRFGDYVYGHTDSCGESGVVFTGNYEDSTLAPIEP